jgi:hypothetical protein
MLLVSSPFRLSPHPGLLIYPIGKRVLAMLARATAALIRQLSFVDARDSVKNEQPYHVPPDPYTQ